MLIESAQDLLGLQRDRLLWIFRMEKFFQSFFRLQPGLLPDVSGPQRTEFSSKNKKKYFRMVAHSREVSTSRSFSVVGSTEKQKKKKKKRTQSLEEKTYGNKENKILNKKRQSELQFVSISIMQMDIKWTLNLNTNFFYNLFLFFFLMQMVQKFSKRTNLIK